MEPGLPFACSVAIGLTGQFRNQTTELIRKNQLLTTVPTTTIHNSYLGKPD
jgi:hypothetical protein